MVRRGLSVVARRVVAGAAVLAALSCEREGEMAESADMPDAAPVRRALEDPARRDALLDTMPGGEMARGDSSAERALLEDKMEGEAGGSRP